MGNRALFPVMRVAARPESQRGKGKFACPRRPSVDILTIEACGAVGDYNHYRTRRFQSTPDRAISIMSMQALQSLRQDGYDVVAGDMGENITLELPAGIALEIGMRLRVHQVDVAADS